MSELLPIETAPKDGRCIILGGEDLSEPGFWHDGSECRRGEAGWFFEDDRGNLLIAKNAAGVTHWMPFPTPPKVRPKLHRFTPDRKYPWFCAECGYAPHEPLKHIQESPALTSPLALEHEDETRGT